MNTRVEKKQFQQKSQHDQRSHDRKFSVGEGIMYRNFSGNEDPKSKSGKVMKCLGSLSFLIQGDDGSSQQRHIDHIVKRNKNTLVDSQDDFISFCMGRE